MQSQFAVGDSRSAAESGRACEAARQTDAGDRRGVRGLRRRERAQPGTAASQRRGFAYAFEVVLTGWDAARLLFPASVGDLRFDESERLAKSWPGRALCPPGGVAGLWGESER